MHDPRMKLPGPDHPITITPEPQRVTVRAAGQVLARSDRALVLREAGYPPVHYLPAADVDLSRLGASTQVSYCPYKGDCDYYDLVGGEPRVPAIAWTYRRPHDAVAAIADHLAFYPDRVDAIEIGGGA